MKYELRMLQDLKAKRERLDMVIAYLEDETASIRKAKAERHAKKALDAMTNGNGHAPAANGDAPTVGTRSPVWNAIIDMLRETESPLNYDDLFRGLMKRKMVKKVKFPHRVIGVAMAQLRKRKLVRQTDDSRWTLN